MERVRLAELLVALSGVADLGMGLPVGTAARCAYVAVELARASNCPEALVSDVGYAALLQHIGCTAYSHEVSALFSDERSIKQASLVTDFTKPREIFFGYLPRITRAAPNGERLRTIRSAMLHSRRMTAGYQLANCETASLVAGRLGCPDGVRAGLLDVFEWWNGAGGPRRLRGEQISLVSRIVNVAGYAVFFDGLGGPDAAVQALTQRSGGYLDPDLVATMCALAADSLAGSAAGDLSDRLLAAEPRPPLHVTDLDAALRAFGEAVDLKSPFLHGHCAATAQLAKGAARRLGLADPALVRRAALAQDIGRVAVPTTIWEHPGPLGTDAWQQVRLHAYHSEQILGRCAALRPVAALAGAHHERLDGSGYHRGTTAALVPIEARVLAAADTYQALVSARPQRAAFPPDRAAAQLRAEARDGRLDPDAVRAVLAAADGSGPVARTRPAGLTDRQVEVLRLIASGMSNKAIAQQLVISPRTAEHHVQDVYARIGVSSRAAAALFAMEHGLL